MSDFKFNLTSNPLDRLSTISQLMSAISFSIIIRPENRKIERFRRRSAIKKDSVN